MPHEQIKSDLEHAAESLFAAVEEFRREAASAVSAAQNEVGDYMFVEYAPALERIPARMPVPRLQLRWEATDAGGYLCRYEMVFPLRRDDIRNEAKTDHCVIELGRTRTSGSVIELDGSIRLPRYDFAHARLDAAAFGGLPIFAIDPTGRHQQVGGGL
jgi:hypothetical protein